MDRVALVLVILGALSWACIGIFGFDIVAWAFHGQGAVMSRIVYTIFGLAGVWCISLLFRERESRHAEDRA
ncbi:MAG: DUF378 domain-containing protein [Oscillospiraceae bacterium]|nr:DUF378 domain-containing protein [Oscillospiraceae bacterium]